MTVAFISHPNCREHQMGSFHPECPERLGAIQDRLIASGLEMLVRHYDAPYATFEQICRVHDAAYIRSLEAQIPDHEGLAWVDGDTALCHHSWSAALRAAGAAVLAVDLVMKGSHQAAFCCVRPPGHHAKRAQAMGFCFFNNVAVGTAHALAQHGAERVAIIDFDVHHGNGTEDIFQTNERVLFCSSFQHPFYPGTGAHSQAPNVINVPLPARTNGMEFRAAVESAWLPRLEAFQPELVMVSAGFDGHAEDDMAHFNLREADYAWITRKIHELAARHADGRIVSCLEGGYNLSALARSVGVHIDELIGHG